MADHNPLDALFEGSEATPATPAQPEQATPEVTPATAKPEADAGQPRDDSGRFASKTQPVEAAPAQSVEIVPPTPAPKPLIDAEQFIPYIKEREKRQKAEADLKALRERVEQQTAQPIPNYLDDPEGYASHLNDQVQRTAISTRFDTSELIARQAHGDDAVKQAMDWGMEKSNASKAFASEYVQQRHPIDWIVKAYKRDQLVFSIGDDADAWALKRAAELAAARAQQPPQSASPASPQHVASAIPPPSPSLASARSAGGAQSIPLGGEAAIDAMFKR